MFVAEEIGLQIKSEIQNQGLTPSEGTFRLRPEIIGNRSEEEESFVADSMVDVSVSKNMGNDLTLKDGLEIIQRWLVPIKSPHSLRM